MTALQGLWQGLLQGWRSVQRGMRAQAEQRVHARKRVTSASAPSPHCVLWAGESVHVYSCVCVCVCASMCKCVLMQAERGRALRD